MLSETTEDLLMLLKSFELSTDTAMGIMSYLGDSEENQKAMINSIIARYEEKGTVTEEELLKMTIMITCKKDDTH